MRNAGRPSRLPKMAGGAAAFLALVGYGCALFFIPQVLDWAFDEGGKAPMLVAVVGAAVTIGTFFGAERLTAKLMAR